MAKLRIAVVIGIVSASMLLVLARVFQSTQEKPVAEYDSRYHYKTIVIPNPSSRSRRVSEIEFFRSNNAVVVRHSAFCFLVSLNTTEIERIQPELKCRRTLLGGTDTKILFANYCPSDLKTDGFAVTDAMGLGERTHFRFPLENVDFLKISGNGSRLVGNYNGSINGAKYSEVFTWDLETGKFDGWLKEKSSDKLSIHPFDVSFDGKYVGAVLSDRSVRVWSTESKEEILRIDSDDGISPDLLRFAKDNRLFIAKDYGKVLVWNVATGELENTIEEPSVVNMVDLSISDDGQFVAIVSNHDNKNIHKSRRVIRVWWIFREKPLMALYGHRNDLVSVDFSSDGNRLASLDLKGVIMIWDTSSLTEKMRNYEFTED